MYTEVANQFEELEDYETASYFYKKCLDVSVETQYVEGEANAYKGLGICEKKVLNIFNAMGNLETALEKAIESEVVRIQKDISTQLVLVYQEIAL